MKAFIAELRKERFDEEAWIRAAPTKRECELLWRHHLRAWRTHPWYTQPRRTETGWTCVADAVAVLALRREERAPTAWVALWYGCPERSTEVEGLKSDALLTLLGALNDRLSYSPGSDVVDPSDFALCFEAATNKFAWFLTERPVSAVAASDRSLAPNTTRPSDEAALHDAVDPVETRMYVLTADDVDTVTVSPSYIFDSVTLITEIALSLQRPLDLLRSPRESVLPLRRALYDAVVRTATQSAFASQLESYCYARRVSPADRRIYVRQCPEAVKIDNANVMALRHLSETQRKFDFVSAFLPAGQAALDLATDAAFWLLSAKFAPTLLVPNDFEVTAATGPRIVPYMNLFCLMVAGEPARAFDSLVHAFVALRRTGLAVRARDPDALYGREVDISAWDAFMPPS